MLIKAAPGTLVRHPHTRAPLPTLGGGEDPIEVSDTDLHFARLLRDGDVVVCKAPHKSSAKPDKKDESA